MRRRDRDGCRSLGARTLSGFSAGGWSSSSRDKDAAGCGLSRAVAFRRCLRLEPLEDRAMLGAHGLFPGEVPPQYAVGTDPYSVTAADVDGDGHVDLVVANYGSHTVSVLRNLGDGTFAARVDYAVGGLPRSVTAADVDGDGHVDLVTADYGSNTV